MVSDTQLRYSRNLLQKFLSEGQITCFALCDNGLGGSTGVFSLASCLAPFSPLPRPSGRAKPERSRFKGVMGVQGDLRGEIEIPPGPSARTNFPTFAFLHSLLQKCEGTAPLRAGRGKRKSRAGFPLPFRCARCYNAGRINRRGRVS